MQATFLDHSGFLVELSGVTLLFDWWKGELPALRREVPLLVFVSHRHEDHFQPGVFALDDGSREVRFLLGADIRLSSRNLARWNVPEERAGKCLRLGGAGQSEPCPGVMVETFPSTDEGVAFLVTVQGQTIFHAGDLNWWHWAGEDPAWNRNMEVNFKKYTQPLRGRQIDLAMLPLDPRLGEAGFLGPVHFLETADIRRFLPMHQWGDFTFTQRFLARYPQYQAVTTPVLRPGQTFSF